MKLSRQCTAIFQDIKLLFLIGTLIIDVKYNILHALRTNIRVVSTLTWFMNTFAWNHRLHLWTWSIISIYARRAKLRKAYVYVSLILCSLLHILIKDAYSDHQLDNYVFDDVYLKENKRYQVLPNNLDHCLQIKKT